MQNSLKDIDSMIFDLDGTLWDSTKEIASSWSTIISKYDNDKKEVTTEELKGYMGLELEVIGERMFPNMDKKNRDILLRECGEFENQYLMEHGATLYDKLEDTLKVLSKKYKLFIVSNCQDGYIETFMKFYNLDKYFVDFECPGRTNLSKAENIKIVIERNNLKHPVYVGDTQMDCDAAKKAGIPFIYARYGFGNTEEYNHVIDKFEELLSL